MEIFINLSKIRMLADGIPYDIISYDEDEHDYTGDSGSGTQRPFRKIQNQEEDAYYNRVIIKEYETVYRPCDKKSNLYILQQNLFMEGGNNLPSHGKSTCSR